MEQLDKQIEVALATAEFWYESHRNGKGGVNTNVMTSGMAIAELLRNQFPLTAESIKSEKNSQVKGLSGSLAKRVLSNFGETRKFTSEGGRTSRGTLVIATQLAKMLSENLGGHDLDHNTLNAIADKLQGFFVLKVQEDYFNKKRLEVAFDTEKPVSGIVNDIFDVARERSDQPTGVVAQHLVGAKLELRFPDLEVGRDKANAADQQTDRQGDFQLGNTAFHVTVAPAAKLADRARDNILQGYRPIMLVPSSEVSFTTGLFKSEGLSHRVEIVSIESFIGSNIEELAFFNSGNIKVGVARLIRRYNERIEACESDQSLRIEEPSWMANLLEPKFEYSAAKVEEQD